MTARRKTLAGIGALGLATGALFVAGCSPHDDSDDLALSIPDQVDEGFWWSTMTISAVEGPQPPLDASTVAPSEPPGSDPGLVDPVVPPTTELSPPPPEPEADEQAVQVDVPSDILFASDAWELDERALDAVARLAAILSTAPGDYVITCHTDIRGDEDYNHELSLKRAESLRDALALHGLDVAVDGRGEIDPVATGDTPTAHELNRRCTATPLAG